MGLWWLQGVAEHVTVEVDYTPDFHMELPSRGDFLKANLAGNRQEDIVEVEK